MANLAMWKKMLTPVVSNEHVKLCILDIGEFSVEQVRKMIKPTVGGTLLDGLKFASVTKEGVKLFKFIRPCDFMVEPLSDFTNPAAIKMLDKETLQFFLDGWKKAYPEKFTGTIRQIIEDFNNL